MTDSEKIEFTTSAFQSLINERQDRLTRGKILREQMFAAINRGEKPTGYRAKWLRDSSMELVEALQGIAKRFDNTHPDDRVSVNDMLDVLTTTLGLFKGALAKVK